MNNKPFYKSWSFCLLFITFLIAVGYIIFAGSKEEHKKMKGASSES